jgi:hypothetical protein
MPEQDKQPSARARLRAWIRQQVAGKSEVSLPDLAERAVKWVRQDKALERAMLEELLSALVYEESRLVLADSRKAPRGAGETLVQMGDQIVSRGALKSRAAAMERFWSRAREHAGSRHVLVLDMTEDDLALAEAERRKRGDTEYEFADLWAMLRKRLEKGQRVRDVWSVEEIEAARQSIKAARAA